MKTGFLQMLKLGFTLALFASVSCVMLAFVYMGTSSVIEQRTQARIEAVLKDFFPDADRFEEITDITSPDPAVTIEGAYSALKDNLIIGVALNLSRAAYGGQIKTMVGVTQDNLIAGARVIEHSETPGLGAHAASSSYFIDNENKITFYGQFAGRNINDPFEVNRDVVAITASTITSSAVSDTVKAAGLAAAAWLSGGR